MKVILENHSEVEVDEASSEKVDKRQKKRSTTTLEKKAPGNSKW